MFDSEINPDNHYDISINMTVGFSSFNKSDEMTVDLYRQVLNRKRFWQEICSSKQSITKRSRAVMEHVLSLSLSLSLTHAHTHTHNKLNVKYIITWQCLFSQSLLTQPARATGNLGSLQCTQVSCISDKSIASGNLGVHKSIIRVMYIHVLDGVLWSMFWQSFTH